MKTVKQVAREYVLNLNEASFTETTIDKAFKAGVKFAEEWISIKDELPDYDQLVLTKDIHDCYDLMCFRIARDEGVSDSDEDIFINSYMWYKLSANFITHWRPINRK